jgi:hypothetical protein
VCFFKADIKFDENGKITKISTGDSINLTMDNISEDQIRVTFPLGSSKKILGRSFFGFRDRRHSKPRSVYANDVSRSNKGTLPLTKTQDS